MLSAKEADIVTSLSFDDRLYLGQVGTFVEVWLHLIANQTTCVSLPPAVAMVTYILDLSLSWCSLWVCGCLEFYEYVLFCITP